MTTAYPFLLALLVLSASTGDFSSRTPGSSSSSSSSSSGGAFLHGGSGVLFASAASVSQREFASALAAINTTANPHWTVFLDRFISHVKLNLISLQGPSTVLIPGNLGNDAMAKPWSRFTKHQRIRILNNLVMRGKFPIKRLLATVPLWQFPTQNGRFRIVKQNQVGQVYFYVARSGSAAQSQVNRANLSETKNIAVHGIFSVPIPANA